MKTIILMAIAAAMSVTACNSNAGNKTSGDNDTRSSETATQTRTASNNASGRSTLNEILPAYLRIKNSLANDNGQDAAAGGIAFVEALEKVDQSTMTADQKKTFKETADDAKEMAEHIGKNAGKIAHQREHFEMLSNDVYDMVKTFKTDRPLYKDFCPMYNNGKGANWLSETKDIQNPYLGKKMPNCGELKEEIK
jgi:hypothetical protein